MILIVSVLEQSTRLGKVSHMKCMYVTNVCSCLLEVIKRQFIEEKIIP